MRFALLQLAEDFLSTIAFLVVYLASGRLLPAIGLALAVSIAQVAIARSRGRSVDLMQWLSLALVVAFGGAALITADSRFMMAKPSIIHFAVGAVMLRPGWMRRYLPPIVTANVAPAVLIASGYAWAALMFALGLINLYVASTLGVAAWAWFISVGALGAKAVALAVQLVVFRVLVRRRVRAAADAREGLAQGVHPRHP
jgi:intracellular septation protein A